MPTDPDAAKKYRQAWLQLAQSTGAAELQFEVAGPTDRYEEVLTLEEGVPVLRDSLGLEIADVINEHGADLMERFPGTHGVALSLRYHDGEILRDQPCLTFFVDDESRARDIPPEVKGVPTDVIEAGVAALHASHTPGLRLRPAEPGCSVSHFRVTSGTLGCLVKDKNDVLYILSCAHVVSDAQGLPKDPIVQQGMKFGGTPKRDCVATFTKSIALQAGDCIADAAIAEVTDPACVTNVIRYIGATPTKTRKLTSVGVSVQKSGDETGDTPGTVIGLNGRVGQFNINGISNISLVDTIITSGMSEPGDSGALLLDNQYNAIGLLFGGQERINSKTGAKEYIASWFTPIETILQALGVDFA